MHSFEPVVGAAAVTQVPIRVAFDGDEVVLWRSADGTAQALLDQCPHAAWRLSAGWVTDDGCIHCPAHGWTFDARGLRVDVGSGPDAVAGYEVAERAGMVCLRRAGPQPSPHQRKGTIFDASGWS